MATLAALGVGAAGMVGKYNRSNFMYDREMRLKQEFNVMGYRVEKAELWRDDIREIIGLTENRMDSYLIVSALQLDMCIGLFCEGRMEPGTPAWLLNVYMITLAGAFMYLLMSVWLAMHAAVVSQCSSVRLLTQYVRLPVPTWLHLESARTYASEFEQLKGRNMMRVPFVGRSHEKQIKRKLNQPAKGVATTSSSSASEMTAETSSVRSGFFQRFKGPRMFGTRSAPSLAQTSSDVSSIAEGSSVSSTSAIEAQQLLGKGSEDMHVDTWNTERLRDDIYELSRGPTNFAHHVLLAKQASRYYQCHDAYARLAMTFGTNQILSALAYFTMGYCSIMIRAMAASWVVVSLAVGISCVLVELDISMTRGQKLLAQLLVSAGPVLASIAVYAWMVNKIVLDKIVKTIYLAHFLWLLFALRRVETEKQPNGSYIPMKFLPMLYLDIFGWLRSKSKNEVASLSQRDLERQMSPSENVPLALQLRDDIGVLKSANVLQAMESHDRDRVDKLSKKIERSVKTTGTPIRKPQKKKVRITGYSDVGVGQSFFVDPDSGEVSQEIGDGVTNVRSLTLAEEQAELLLKEQEEEDTKNSLGHWLNEEEDPLAWDCLSTFQRIRRCFGHMSKPFVDDEMQFERPSSYYDIHATFPCIDEEEEVIMNRILGKNVGKMPYKLFRAATLLLCSLWVISFFLPVHLGARSNQLYGMPSLSADMQRLEDGELIQVGWPSHDGFFPRAMSCDESGHNLVVADDFGVYAIQLPGANNAHWPSHGDGHAKDAAGKIKGYDENSLPSGTGSLINQASSLLPAPMRNALRGHSVLDDLRPDASFERVPVCEALEGQTVLDIDVMCQKDVASLCRVLVLHGRNLTECPLIFPSDKTLPGPTEVARSWMISDSWLRSDQDETIVAAAVNGDCISNATRRVDTAEMTNEGCLVVGTSQGRVVQLRRHLLESHTLVPDKTMMKSQSLDIAANHLHVFQGRLIMTLRYFIEGGHRTLQAFSAERGHLEGEWLLPADVQWLAICGGTDSLFLLGRKLGLKGVQLWRFEVPAQLKAILEA